MKKITVFSRRAKIVLFIFVLSSVFYIRSSEAAKDNNGFDDRFTYDIYLVGKDEPSSVIRRVEITRFQQVGGKTFLVIKSKGFHFREAEGFIFLDSVAAILPSDELRLNEN